jgi:hypothetical protein
MLLAPLHGSGAVAAPTELPVLSRLLPITAEGSGSEPVATELLPPLLVLG